MEHLGFQPSDDTSRYLDVPLFQPDAFECVAVIPKFADSQRVTQNQALLSTIVAEIQREYIETQFKDHIWHKESLHVRLGYSDSVQGNYYIHGISHYGGCVDDEWLMIHIMYQITLKYPDVFVRLTDTDGDVLLIQAAEELPDWMEPENTRNRAWLHQGKVLIIPPEYGNHGPLHFPEALEYLKTHPYELESDLEDKKSNTTSLSYLHNPSLDYLALERVHVYPEHSANLIQRSNIYVPRKVAALLHSNPQLIALACSQLDEVISEAYQENNIQQQSQQSQNQQQSPELLQAAALESISQKLQNLQHIPLRIDEFEVEREKQRDDMSENSESSMVLYSAKFTKHIYARFMVDPSNPPPWFSAFIPDDDRVSYEASMLGTKVTGSLDLLLREQSKAEKEREKEQSKKLLKDVDDGEKDEQKMFDNELEIHKEMFTSMPYMKNSEKERLFESLFNQELESIPGKKVAERVNAIELYKEILQKQGGLPTNKTVNGWDKTVNSNQWFYEMLDPSEAAAVSGRSETKETGTNKEERGFDFGNDVQSEKNNKQEEETGREKGKVPNMDKPDAKEFDEMKERLGGLFSKVTDYLNAEEDDGEEEEDDDDSSSSDEDEPMRDRTANDKDTDVDIDEDDFFEFFLKEALKLTPEQIEEYRRAEDKEGKESSGKGKGKKQQQDADEEWEREGAEEAEELKNELEDYGILDKGIFGSTDRKARSRTGNSGKKSGTGSKGNNKESYDMEVDSDSDSDDDGDDEEIDPQQYEAMLSLLSSLTAAGGEDGGSRGTAPMGPAAAMFSGMGVADDPMFKKMMGFGSK